MMPDIVPENFTGGNRIMFKRCRFIVALMVCVYVFAFGVVGTACAVETPTFS